MGLFEQCLAIVVATEGGLSKRPEDPGNWSEGKCGFGECRGTKYGISAASYPHLDIANLTLEQAAEIYRRDYWQPVCADQMPPALALIMFDAAVNSGTMLAVRWLQQALSVPTDGIIGPRTLSSIATRHPPTLAAEVLAKRLVYDASLALWRTDGLGWARRLCRLPFQATTLVAT